MDSEHKPLVDRSPPSKRPLQLFMAFSFLGFFVGLFWVGGFWVAREFRLPKQLRLLALSLVVVFFIRLAVLFLVLGLYAGNVF